MSKTIRNFGVVGLALVLIFAAAVPPIQACDSSDCGHNYYRTPVAPKTPNQRKVERKINGPIVTNPAAGVYGYYAGYYGPRIARKTPNDIRVEWMLRGPINTTHYDYYGYEPRTLPVTGPGMLNLAALAFLSVLATVGIVKGCRIKFGRV